MIRAIFFDFYGVWLPDKFLPLLQRLQQENPELVPEVGKKLDQYYVGRVYMEGLIFSLNFNLGMGNLRTEDFIFQPQAISPAVIDLMHGLHGHFVKIGVLANLGKAEFEALAAINQQFQLFEVITGPIATGASLLSETTFVSAYQAIGEPPETCLMVSSNALYLDFAKQCGSQTLPYSNMNILGQDLAERLQQ